VPLRAGFIVVAAVFHLASTSEPAAPIRSGTYSFELRDAEFPDMPGVALRVIVEGTRIKVISSDSQSKLFPRGTVVDEGLLLFHRRTKQWIIGTSASDVEAEAVGGCTVGPAVVDLEARVYWYC
jgi:hypothetical protein